MGDGVITLARWRRYQHDRLYVRDATGVQVGWLDLRTGDEHREADAHWDDAIDAAIDDWLTEHQELTTLRTNGPGRAGVRDHRPGSGAPRRDTATDAASPRTTGISQPATMAPTNGVGDAAAVADAIGQVMPSSESVTDLADRAPGTAVLEEARRRTTWWTRVGRLLGLRTGDASWRSGAQGERKVAAVLHRMEALGWRTLHAVPVGDHGADIDHVVIGPGGVFTLNTKHHPRSKVRFGRQVVFVNGRKTDYVQRSLHEAKRASKLLSAAAGHRVKVKPLLVFVGAVPAGDRCGGVIVLAKRRLLVHLQLRSRELTDGQIDQLYDVARYSTTWQPSEITTPAAKEA